MQATYRSFRLRYAAWWPEPIIAAVGCLLVLIVLVAPYANAPLRARVGAVARPHDGQWIVLSVADDSGAARAGLQRDDIILALDGNLPAPLRTEPDLDFGQTTQWKIIRNGATVVLQRPVSRPGPGYDGQALIWLLVALTFWGVGTFVLIRKPNDGMVRRLHRLNMATAIVLALVPAVATDLVWAKVVEVSAFGLLPGLFADFFLAFVLGGSPGRFRAIALSALYISGAVAGALMLVLGFLHSDAYDLARALLLGVLAIGFLWGLTHLARANFRPSSPVQRQQARIILFGAAAAVIPLIALSVLPVIFGQQPVIYKSYAPLCAVFLPIAISYAVFCRGFLAIDVVERTIVYALMTLLLAGCYALLLYVLGTAGYTRAAENYPALVVAFFAAVTLTFIPVRDRIHRLIDHFIYRDRYDYASTLRALGTQLSSIAPMDEVLSAVVNSLAGAMNLTGAAVFLRTPEGDLAIRAACGALQDPPSASFILTHLVPHDALSGTAVAAGHCIPLVAHGEQTGFLYLGRKRSPADLSVEDLNMAETTASQIAVAVANALLLERLKAKVDELELLRDQMLHVEEEERKRLAQNLHDGPMHSALDLVRRAESLMVAAGNDGSIDRRYAEQLFALAERGRDATYELRTVCSDLYPSELGHLGLPAALESLARRISRDEDVSVHFVAHTFPVDLRLREDVENGLYRVAREALDNACRHSKARDVELSLDLVHTEVTVSIRDNGCGFVVPASYAVFLRKGHLGLASLRERLERLGGNLLVRSASGQGTEVRAQLLLKAELMGNPSGGTRCRL